MTSLLPVTVAIPVRNEAANLARCLGRLRRFSEIVVIDSNSSDSTLEIADAFQARIEQFNWDGLYPKKRNWLLLNAPPKQPWVLFLDADEYVDDAFCDALAEAITHTDKNGFWLNYNNIFLGRRLRHGLPQRKLALFRVGKALYERIEEEGWSDLDMEVHEHPIVEGEVGEITAPIEHHDFRGLSHFIGKHKDYAEWEARRYLTLRAERHRYRVLTGRQRFKYAHLAKFWYPWFYFAFVYFVKCGFMDGRAGFNYAFYKVWYFQSVRLMIKENGALGGSGKPDR